MTRKMKDSGVEWIGEIPEDWELVKFKRLFRVLNGREIKVELDENDKNSIDVYGSGGIFKYTNEFLCDKRSILFGRKGTIGKPIIIDGRFWTVDTMYYTDIIYGDIKYIYYLLKIFPWSIITTQTALPSITSSDLLNKYISIAPFKKQKAIADFLDKKVLEIDNIISKTKTVIEEYKQYKQSLIAETVTKGLDENVEMRDSGVEWIGEIPEHWDAINMKYILSLRSGDSLINSLLDNKSTYPVYGGGRRIGFFEKWNVTKENILIGRVGANCGCITELTSYAWATDNALVVSTNYNKKYIYYLLASSNLNDLNESNAQPLITGTKVLNYKVPFISKVNEQKSIVSYLDKKCTQIDNIISSKEKLLTEMESYKKSLIYETVTGKREV